MNRIIYFFALGSAFYYLGLAGGCTVADRASLRDAVGDIAAQVCVKGDSVEVCLEKCLTECRVREKRQLDGGPTTGPVGAGE